MIQLSIGADIKAGCPTMRIGFLHYQVQTEKINPALWDLLNNTIFPALLRQMEETSIPQLPNVAEARQAYKNFGKDPGRYRVSSEAMYRRIKQGKGLYKINTVVDVNNLVSLETGFSVGSYDLAKVEGGIEFRIGREGETYQGIGKDTINIESLPVLCDDKGPFGSPTSDSVRAMITLDTKEVLTVLYDFTGTGDLEAMLARAAQKFAAYANATEIQTGIIC